MVPLGQLKNSGAVQGTPRGAPRVEHLNVRQWQLTCVIDCNNPRCEHAPRETSGVRTLRSSTVNASKGSRAVPQPQSGIGGVAMQSKNTKFAPRNYSTIGYRVANTCAHSRPVRLCQTCRHRGSGPNAPDAANMYSGKVAALHNAQLTVINSQTGSTNRRAGAEQAPRPGLENMADHSRTAAIPGF